MKREEKVESKYTLNADQRNTKRRSKMTQYVALLRGINLGKHNKIKMADLKALFELNELKNVQTYIQSGNVLFESHKSPEKLIDLIESAILTEFGYTVPVIIRTAAEVRSILERCPYSAEQLGEEESIHIILLGDIPAKESIEKLKLVDSMDEWSIVGKEVYLLLRQSFHTSKLPNQLKKLDVAMTLRNWNTMSKLSSLAAERLKHAETEGKKIKK